jgi:hypothetical protein
MAFKLDDDTHFLARIAATHILPPATHVPSRFGRTNLINDWKGKFWQPEALEPGQEIFVFKHDSSSAGAFISSSISIPLLILQGMYKPHSSFVH